MTKRLRCFADAQHDKIDRNVLESEALSEPFGLWS